LLEKKIPVSIVVTVYNEDKDIHFLFESILRQTVQPMELIIVDGGSSDGTAEKISSFIQAGNDWAYSIIDPSCSSKFSNSPIAKGRNIGISKATQEFIAVTDASSLLASDWLEKLTQPLIDNSADYVGGFYEIDRGKSMWGRFFAILNMPVAENSSFFIPSSRSFAFRKSLWQQVGGYPLGYKYGEDTEFVLRIEATGARRSIKPDASVKWFPTNTDSWKGGVNLMYKYARGNGQRNLLPKRSCKLLIYYSLLTLFFVLSAFYFTNSTLFLGLLFLFLSLIFLCGLIIRAMRIFRKSYHTKDDIFNVWFALYLSSFDIASIVGYVHGVMDRIFPFNKV
jgi:glycosyltransferase involved in cell wall biosynthesis